MFVHFEPAERRYRIMAVAPELLMNLTINPQLDGDDIRALTVDGLPADVRIQAVCWSDEKRCFLFRLHSDTWDVVEECTAIPAVTVTVTAHQLRVDRTEQPEPDLVVMPFNPFQRSKRYVTGTGDGVLMEADDPAGPWTPLEKSE